MIKTNEKKVATPETDTKGPVLVSNSATDTKGPVLVSNSATKLWIRKEKVYLGAASHLKHAALAAMRTTVLKNTGILPIHVDYIIGEPITDVLDRTLALRDKSDRGHFRLMVFLDKPGELDPFNSIRDSARKLNAHCKQLHDSTSNHKCQLVLATGVRLPAYDLPKLLSDRLDLVQFEIYRRNVKKYETLRTSIKRYSATEHINVLELRNPMSWRQYKTPEDWLEDFRTESGKVGNIGNMSTLCVPKGLQLDAFVNGVVNYLTDTPQMPENYDRLLNSGYDLSRPGTKSQTLEEEHKLHNKRVCKEAVPNSGYDCSKPGPSGKQSKEAGHKLHTKRAHTEGPGSASMPITIDGDIFGTKKEPREASEQEELTRNEMEAMSIHELLANPYSNVRRGSNSESHSRTPSRHSLDKKERRDKRR